MNIRIGRILDDLSAGAFLGFALLGIVEVLLWDVPIWVALAATFIGAILSRWWPTDEPLENRSHPTGPQVWRSIGIGVSLSAVALAAIVAIVAVLTASMGSSPVNWGKLIFYVGGALISTGVGAGVKYAFENEEMVAKNTLPGGRALS